MKLLYNRYFILVFILWFSGCKKEEMILPKDISGTWDWIFTYKAYPLSDTNPLTPQNTGIKEIIVFNSDMSWTNTQNNIVIDSGTYSLGHGSRTSYPGAQTYVYDSIVYYRNGIQINGGFDYYIIFNDTLEFSPGFSGRLFSYTLPYNGAKFWIKN